MKKIQISFLLTLAVALSAPAGHAETSTPLDEARAALKANDLAKAEALLAPLTVAGATDAAAFHALGQLRQRENQPKAAVGAYEQATKLDATKPEYFSALGIALGQSMAGTNMMQQAMVAGKMKKAFEKSVALEPQHLPGLIGLCRYYSNAPEIAGGSIARAKEFAGRVQAINPFLGEVESANIAEKDDDYAEALVHLDAALKMKPNTAGLLASSGRVLAKLGRKDEARARFEAALKINPALESAQRGLDELAEKKA